MREHEVAYPSFDTIKEDIFIENDKTLKLYIDALVELDLIRYAYAGDRKRLHNGKVVYSKSNLTYVLFANPVWESDLQESINEYKRSMRNQGWSFVSKEEALSANERRSITQKINALEKKQILTQSEKKELKKLKRKQEKYKREYTEDNRIIEEKELLRKNPGKPLWEIYYKMGYKSKAIRALRDDGHEGTDLELLDFLDNTFDESDDVWGEALESLGLNDDFEEILG